MADAWRRIARWMRWRALEEDEPPAEGPLRGLTDDAVLALVEAEFDAGTLARLGRVVAVESGASSRWQTQLLARLWRALVQRDFAGPFPGNARAAQFHAVPDLGRQLRMLAAMPIKETPHFTAKSLAETCYALGSMMQRLLLEVLAVLWNQIVANFGTLGAIADEPPLLPYRQAVRVTDAEAGMNAAELLNVPFMMDPTRLGERFGHDSTVAQTAASAKARQRDTGSYLLDTSLIFWRPRLEPGARDLEPAAFAPLLYTHNAQALAKVLPPERAALLRDMGARLAPWHASVRAAVASVPVPATGRIVWKQAALADPAITTERALVYDIAPLQGGEAIDRALITQAVLSALTPAAGPAFPPPQVVSLHRAIWRPPDGGEVTLWVFARSWEFIVTQRQPLHLPVAAEDWDRAYTELAWLERWRTWLVAIDVGATIAWLAAALDWPEPGIMAAAIVEDIVRQPRARQPEFFSRLLPLRTRRLVKESIDPWLNVLLRTHAPFSIGAAEVAAMAEVMETLAHFLREESDQFVPYRAHCVGCGARDAAITHVATGAPAAGLCGSCAAGWSSSSFAF
jgi:hypothetical protein